MEATERFRGRGMKNDLGIISLCYSLRRGGQLIAGGRWKLHQHFQTIGRVRDFIN